MQREYEVMGRRLQIHLGDITRLEVGAIVSSENSDLIMDQLGSPSVSAAIRAIEGEELARDLSRMGPIEPGRAVVTPARNLPCRWVIHAASVIKTGPDETHQSSLRILREAVRSSLRLAAGLGLESVAFPAFGVRATSISRKQASQAMVDELVSGLHEQTSLRRVVIALLDSESFLAFFEEAMKRATQANQPLTLRASPSSEGLAFSFEADGPLDRLYTCPFPNGGLNDVQAALARLKSAAERRLLDAKGELRNLGFKLQALLPPEVSARLSAEPKRPLVLRIDEELAGLPFELAWNGEAFLGERRSVSRQLITRSAPASAAPCARRAKLEVLLLGGSLERLPASGREVEALAGLLWRRAQPRTRVTALADQRATRAALLSALPNIDVLHWCGHTAAPASWELAAEERFSAEDLAGLQLRTRLVVANSCGPDGGAALPRAFLLAGARNYIGTLWDVDDALAKAFALRLFEHLLNGQTLGESLREARQELLAQDPLHWASYVHYGHPAERLFEPLPVSLSGSAIV